ncbi:hypothetical protein BDB00DRAFT_883084 [Zychaea mexicana]|uniref:uncharacterized protein n=1 Tax=Zychaea mexicana TaxID=64656 RepID=UPI0022FE7968|nr:uncharacterized protein BDB00DRAFT_883084 [Zychaea mexicana]KAI9493606.1 hypothetical protein BDB00DRAFT_883084 [Zychaea mexicana]
MNIYRLDTIGRILSDLPNNVFTRHNFKASQQRSKALVDLAQESILLYPYKSVPAQWRQLLMDASILQAITMLGLFQHSSTLLELQLRDGDQDIKQRIARETINVLDTAMIISGAPGPQRRETVLASIDTLQAYLSSLPSSSSSSHRLRDGFIHLPAPHTVHTTHPVNRLDKVPSFLAFVQLLQNGQPFIIPQGAIEHWPARDKWPSLSYFVSVAGDRVVPVELGSKYTDSAWQQKMMRVEDFLREHVVLQEEGGDDGSGQTAYLAQHDLFYQIPKLADDISVPDYCYCEPELNENYKEAPVDVIQNAWFGPQGTVSPLHHDPYHNVLAQVVGSKYIRLYAPSETHCLYPYEGIMSNTSQVDVEHPDFDSFPLLKEAQFVDCTLQAGELLYMPPKWWHYVRSLETSFSVSFWF